MSLVAPPHGGRQREGASGSPRGLATTLRERRVSPAYDGYVAATGYGRALDGLVGRLGVLDFEGYPLVTGAEPRPVPGYPPAAALVVGDEVKAREAKE